MEKVCGIFGEGLLKPLRPSPPKPSPSPLYPHSDGEGLPPSSRPSPKYRIKNENKFVNSRIFPTFVWLNYEISGIGKPSEEKEMF